MSPRSTKDAARDKKDARPTSRLDQPRELRGRLLPGTAIYVAQLAARGCSGACAGGCSAP